MPKTMVDKIYIARDENYTSEFWLVTPLDNGVGHEEYYHKSVVEKLESDKKELLESLIYAWKCMPMDRPTSLEYVYQYIKKHEGE